MTKDESNNKTINNSNLQHNNKIQSRRNNNKGQNATHLLNFHTSTQEQQQQQQRSNSNFNNNNRHQRNNNKQHTKKQSNNKSKEEQRARQKSEFYLFTSSKHAFIISRTNNKNLNNLFLPAANQQHQTNVENTNACIQWEVVKIVKCFIEAPNTTTKEISNLLDSMTICPICLDEFVAPRITKCGHVFCFSCLLHHFHNNTNSTEVTKCPCCFKGIYVDDLRNVQFHTIQSPKKGNSITLQRLHRSPTCLSPYTTPQQQRNTLPISTDDDALYSRVNYIDYNVWKFILIDEICVLEAQLKKGGLMIMEATFVSVALEAVRLQLDFISKYQQIDTEESMMSNQVQKVEMTKKEEDNTTLFYQASDGQLIFVSQFNMQCLSEEYSIQKQNSMPPFPNTIQGHILKTSSLQLNNETRKRLSFLSHLSVYTDITFVELELINPKLSSATRTKFKIQLDEHKRARQKEKRKEKRLDRLAIEETQRKMEGLVVEATWNNHTIHYSNGEDEFNLQAVTDVDFPSVEQQQTSLTATTTTTTELPRNNNRVIDANSISSFSNVCASNGFWPTLQNNEDSSHYQTTTTTRGRSVWNNNTSSSQQKEEVKDNNNSSSIEHQTSCNINYGKKKKKGKKIVLFSTGGHRRN